MCWAGESMMDDTAATLREMRVKWESYKKGEPGFRNIFPLEANKYICGKCPLYMN